MRHRRILYFILLSSICACIQSKNVGMNLPCNKELDGLLASDPDGNESAFLSCQGVGVGTIGFWERKICPDGMTFNFINQECRVKGKKARKQQVLNIAILNNSCAKGETCIGGTVCDLDTLKCLCPYGTVPQLETLSCESSEPAYIAAELPPQYVAQVHHSVYGGAEKSNIGFFPNSNSPSSSFAGFQASAQMQPFKFSNYPSTGSNPSGKGQFSFNWNQPAQNNFQNPGFLPESGASSYSSYTSKPTNPFLSQTNQQSSAAAKTVPVLARPGQSCRKNEVCGGGSICTLPIGLCLCPGDLVEMDGECVVSPHHGPSINRVGIGAVCNEMAECDDGATCILGRCSCVAPLVQHEGKCVLKSQRKEVGPGDLCDNGEVCVKGSVCDAVIPVCVCPVDTDLNNGECVRVMPTLNPHPHQPAPIPDTLPSATRSSNAPYIAPHTSTHSPPPQVYTYRPPPQTAAPSSNSVNYNSYGNVNAGNYEPDFLPVAPSNTPQPPIPQYRTTATPYRPPQPPTIKPIVKPSPIKMGGSKQAGVGVRCSLNTDCMIGAYCNGNTNPPSCQCLSTHVNIEGRCEKVVYPGQVGCRSDAQCTAAYHGTACIDRMCICPEGMRAVDQTCVPANEPVTSPPGGSCSEARECTGGSICREGWCICPDASMIVQKGICIQSGLRPTLPPKISQTASHYSSAAIPSYQTAAPIPTYKPKPIQKPSTVVQPQSSFNSHSSSGRKAVPGSSCGPLDTCVGGSSCIDNVCICPVGMEPSQAGRCEKPQQIHTHTHHTNAGQKTHNDKHKIFTASANKQTSTIYSRPGAECGSGQICTGGSSCNTRNVCMCPADRPIVKDGECIQPARPERKEASPGQSCDENTICIRGSNCIGGFCRCPSGQVAVAGYCASVPQTTTTAKAVTYAKPLESCDNGEKCEGGSSCDYDTGICMCPRGQIVFGTQCMDPPTRSTSGLSSESTRPATYQTERPSSPTTECENDANCGDNKICLSGRCRCMPGFIDNAGLCEPLEKIEAAERPVPISYARHKVQTLNERPRQGDNNSNSRRAMKQEAERQHQRQREESVEEAGEETGGGTTETTEGDGEEAETQRTTTRRTTAQRRESTQKPRVVGPPIRRPKPKKNRGGGQGKGGSGSSRGSGGGGGGSGSYKTGSGNGNCPPGNEATRDEDGRLIVCNGLEPNCPPRSYCYITSGGFATEEYNCCKSW